MNNRAFFVAVICGLLSALMLAAPLQLGSFGVTLFMFAATPVCVAALGFGTVAGIASGIIGAIAVASFMGPVSGASVFVFTLLPGIWAGHLAGLVSHDDGTERWYPLSNIVGHLAMFAVIAVLVSGAINGLNGQSLAELIKVTLTDMSQQATTQNPDLPTLPEQDVAVLAAQVAAIFPLFAPAFLFTLYILNLSFGASIARAFGWMLRPKDDIPAAAGANLVFVGLFALSMIGIALGGTFGMIAKVVAGGSGAALMYVGFATMHFLTRGNPARGLILGGTYALTLLTLLPLIPMVILGVAETLLGLRARRATPPPST